MGVLEDLQRIIAEYNRCRDKYFASFSCADMVMLLDAGIIDRWVQEENGGNDMVPGDIYAKLILKEKLKRWKQKYSIQQSIETMYNNIISQ